MKTEMTSFDVSALTLEISRSIKGAWIKNIYQVAPKTLLLELHQPDEHTQHLIVEAGKRLHLTSYILEKPPKPPAFCMALRKHIRNGRVQEVQQHEFERTVSIKVETRKGEFQLITELFGGGNIVLVNPEGKILQALTYKRMRDRNVLRGETFQYAPSTAKNPITSPRLDFDELRSYGRMEVVRALTRLFSIGGLYAEETLLRVGVDRNKPCESLSKEEIDNIHRQLSSMLTDTTAGRVQPHIVVDEKGEWLDVTPIQLRKYASFKQIGFKTFNEALDEYYTKTTMEERKEKNVEQLEQELARQRRVLQDQLRTLEDSRREMEQNRRIGDAIYAHLGELQLLLQRALDQREKGKSWKEIILGIEEEKREERIPAKYFHSFHPRGRILELSMEGLTFPMDIRRSVQDNAASYYVEAKKAERRWKGAEKALQETMAAIQELERQTLEQTETVQRPPPRMRRKAWYEKFRWFRSSEGLLIVGGRDATTNEILVKRHVDPHDLVFHADAQGAPFVVVKTEGKAPSEQTLWESARFASSYSRAWRENLGTINIYWVRPEQVDKSPPPGQYLKKGSFMIHGIKNYVRNVPLGVAIGIKSEEEHLMVVGGPVEAVSQHTRIYAEISPGMETSGKLAKQIRKQLAGKASGNLKKQILETPLSEIQRFIPAGRGCIKSQ